MSRPARPLPASTATRLAVAAADAFAHAGLDGASLNGILRQAGMGKGSFYHYFADKAALHDWVTKSLSAALLSEVRPPQLQTLTSVTFRPELSAALDRLGEVAIRRPDLMDLGRMFHKSSDVPAGRAIANVRGVVIAWLTEALRTGQTLGVIRDDLPLDLLTAWTIASLTVIDQWVLTASTPATIRHAAADAALESLWQILNTTARGHAGANDHIEPDPANPKPGSKRFT